MRVVPGPASQDAVIKRVYTSPGLQYNWLHLNNLCAGMSSKDVQKQAVKLAEVGIPLMSSANR